MSSQPSIIKNLFYNVLLQFVSLVIPLLTVPYISRILGANGVGAYSYTYSISQYFILLGTLGLSLYGNRQIAYSRNNKKKLSDNFWGIFFLRCILSCISLSIYIVFIYNLEEQYRILYVLQAINIISNIVDISWLYMGLEDFKKTVWRNLLVKVAGILLIFILINNSSQILLYALINVITLLISNLILWLYLPRLIVPPDLTLKEIFKHFRPALQIFIPQIAIQIYVVLDKSMLGYITQDVTQVGYYEQSDKLVKAALSLVTSLGVVMLPRMSNLYANKQKDKMKEYLNLSLSLMIMIALPMTTGIAAIASGMIPWFLGDEFSEAIKIIILLCPILFLIAISNITGVQYLLPSNQTKIYTLSVWLGAILNLVLNVILIKYIGVLGACLSTVVAELSVTLTQLISIRQEILWKSIIKDFIKYFYVSVIMGISVYTIGYYLNICFFSSLLQVIIGILFYILILVLTHDKNICYILKIILKYFQKNIK